LIASSDAGIPAWARPCAKIPNVWDFEIKKTPPVRWAPGEAGKGGDMENEGELIGGESLGKNIVRVYRLDFADSVSAAERGKVSVRLDEMGALSSDAIQTRRSGPFGLEYTHLIEFIMVTTLNDWEDGLFKRAVESESCFSVCTLTQVK